MTTHRWQRHFDTLGERDPLDILRHTPDELRRIVEHHSADVLRQRPFEGKWTPNEILGHLADHEIVSMCRIRTMRFDDVPWLSRYDQERWVQMQGHNEREPDELVRRFVELRTLNLEQYESLSPDEMTRANPRSDGGAMALADLLRVHAGHDLSHLDQIARYLQAVPDGV
ncbi:MAG: DinB family protein [Phycisphaerales bacterium]